MCLDDLASLTALLQYEKQAIETELNSKDKTTKKQQKSTQQTKVIYTQPGEKLLAFSRLWFSEKLNERVFEALVAEEQIKHEAIYMDKRYWAARMVRVQLVKEFSHEVIKQWGLALFNRAYQTVIDKSR